MLTLPAGDAEPAPQEVHAVAVIAPEYLPAPQSVHASLPLPALYVPAAHESHPPAPSLVKPALQIQAEAASLPAGESEATAHAEQVLSSVASFAVEYLPATQSVQPASPALSLYLPASQPTHAPSSDPENPALHIHTLPSELYAPAGQAAHVPDVSSITMSTVSVCAVP